MNGNLVIGKLVTKQLIFCPKSNNFCNCSAIRCILVILNGGGDVGGWEVKNLVVIVNIGEIPV